MRSIRKRLVVWLLVGLAVLWATAGAGVYFAVKRGETARLDARLENLSGGVRFFGSRIAGEAAREAREAEREREAELARIAEEGGETPEGGPPGSTAAPGSADPRGDGEPRRPDARREEPERPRPTGEPDRGRPPPPDDNQRREMPPFFQEDGDEFFHLRSQEAPALERRSTSLGDDRDLPPPGGAFPDEPLYYDSHLPDGSRVRAVAFDFRPRSWRRRGDGEGAELPELQAVVAIDAEPMHATLRNVLLGIGGVGALAALASVGLVHFALRDGLKPLRRLGDQLGEIDAASLDGRFSSKGMPLELTPITERLNALMARLEKSFERERRFSSDLAHELRTPVAELRTMSEVSLRFGDGTADREQTEQTLEIAEDMGAIIEALLALGRYENGQAEIEREEVDLGGFAADCWRPFEARAAGRNLRAELHLQPGGTVATDAKLLRLILTNLFSNAVEYTPEGGAVSIRNDGASLAVRNDAPELTREQLPQLFERFWRADGSRTGGGHSGLGLPLASACAEVLGLRLTAELDGGQLELRLRGAAGHAAA